MYGREEAKKAMVWGAVEIRLEKFVNTTRTNRQVQHSHIAFTNTWLDKRNFEKSC